MADIKWSAFPNGGALIAGDIIVGLRAGANFQFTAPIFGSDIVNVTTPTQAMAVNTIYVANDPTSLVTFTLPLTAAFGTIIQVVGNSVDGWTIAQNAGQSINMGNKSTTGGVGGSTSSTNQYDQITFFCVVANTTWNVTGAVGNLTIV
jgi:hypothetical protein